MKLVPLKIGEVSGWAVDTWLQAGLRHGFFDRTFDASALQVSTGKSGWRVDEVRLLQQCHGATVVDANCASEIAADGWLINALTAVPAVYGIKTADCFPVLVTAKQGRYLSALHCGWRGTVGGILPGLISHLLRKGVRPDEIEVAIGPGALSCCYEIGDDVAEQLGEGAVVHRSGRLFGDLVAQLALQAIALGVPLENIVDFSRREHFAKGDDYGVSASGLCTICSKSFFSYRREKELSGRQLSFFQLV